MRRRHGISLSIPQRLKALVNEVRVGWAERSARQWIDGGCAILQEASGRLRSLTAYCMDGARTRKVINRDDRGLRFKFRLGEDGNEMCVPVTSEGAEASEWTNMSG